MNVLVDEDKVGVLRAVLVEGSLVFEPSTNASHCRTFDAFYIMVKDGGLMQVGTEADPYTSKIIFTLHGNKATPKLPQYGNKVIAVRHATLDLHGKPIMKVTSQLGITAEAGSQSITLVDAVDWKVGDELVIASSAYDGEEAEHVKIATIVNGTDADGNSVSEITLVEELEFAHESVVETLSDGHKIYMRAEVGLLTRSIVI
jgi:hypothetical protein